MYPVIVKQPTQPQTDDNIFSTPLNSQVSRILEFQQLHQAYIYTGEQQPDQILLNFLNVQDSEILRSRVNFSVHYNLILMSLLII